MKVFLFWLSRMVLLFILPFILLIRGAVFLHHQYTQIPAYFALLGGLALTCLLLYLYLTYFISVVTPANSRPSSRFRLVVVLGLLGCYAIYTLFYLSNQNIKYPEIRNEYLELHPILRVAVSTWVFVDPGLVITDANRTPHDYGKWGLPSNSNSLHFRQGDGFVYAVDLRTHDRSGLRNWITRIYFRLMGFHVMWHGGTGDHLHVSLTSHERPYSR
ncbi:MAG: hypothetical protein HKN87_19150 [Saprospiraceae bacterium]|nr:hypothetical protein [Saprospiraceae bacterium]